MKATIYHNPRCSKSRETFALLEKGGVDIEIIEYLKEPPTKEKLKELLEMLGMEACELVRKNEPIFKEEYAKPDLTNEDCLKAMVENPILIERPIVVVGNSAALCRPPENVLLLLK